jgi:hypothetical protein
MTEDCREIITRAQATAAGLPRYYTGKPCLKGHDCERQTGNGNCMACAREHQRDHYADPENKKHKRLYNQEYAADPKNQKRNRLYSRERQQDPEAKERRRRLHRARTYNLSHDEYEALFQQQNGSCAVCQEHLTTAHRGTHVDHCHKSKFVRGLLCPQCNRELGVLESDRYPALIAYLENHAWMK